MTDEFEAKTSLLGRIFCGQYDTILVNDASVVLMKKGATVEEIPFADILSFSENNDGFFASSIEFPLDKGSRRKFGWIKKAHASALRDFLNLRLQKIVNSKIRKCAKDFDHLTITHYPRDSWEDQLKELGDRLGRYKPHLNHELVENDNREALVRVLEFLPVDLEKLRAEHERIQLEIRKDFFDAIETYPLTSEQRLGVIRSNDSNMVLAAAGTGKTSVIVSKIFDLIERNLCDPAEILVMAFNRVAALEVRERFRKGVEKRGLTLASEPDISTFHALGRKILQDSGIRPTISKLAEDEIRMNAWVTRWVERMINEDVENFLQLLSFIPEP